MLFGTGLLIQLLEFLFHYCIDFFSLGYCGLLDLLGFDFGCLHLDLKRFPRCFLLCFQQTTGNFLSHSMFLFNHSFLGSLSFCDLLDHVSLFFIDLRLRFTLGYSDLLGCQSLSLSLAMTVETSKMSGSMTLNRSDEVTPS